ncbi:MAG: hypothetical protein AAFV96_00445 [Pseudomonadota bacterium]
MSVLRQAVRIVTRLAGLAAFAWVVLVGAVLIGREGLIYPLSQGFDVTQVSGLPRGRLATLAAADGTPVHAWVAPPVEGRPVILHFTGNAGFTPGAAIRMAPFVIRGYGLAILNYRGAGGAPGAPGEAAIIADALALYDALEGLMGPMAVPPVIHGTSLGAAVAVRVAAARPASAVVLALPFAEVCTVAEHHYPWLPACLLAWDDRWESVRHAPAIRAPVLVTAAGRDRVIPRGEARRLFDTLNAEKRFVFMPDAGHDGGRAGTEAALDWVARHAG